MRVVVGFADSLGGSAPRFSVPSSLPSTIDHCNLLGLVVPDPRLIETPQPLRAVQIWLI